MDEQIPDQEKQPHPSHSHQPADTDAQEFMQWMKEYGRPAMIGLVVVVVVMLGVSVWRKQQAAKSEAAVQALFQGRSPEEFQQLALTDPKSPTAPVALATAAAEFYAENRYDEALVTYRSFLTQYPDHMLVADAELGVASSLEALEEYDEAATAYMAFAEGHSGNPMEPRAVFGAARCREQLEQFDEARALYEEFIVANPDSTSLAQAESGLLFLNKAERAKDLPPPVVAPVREVMDEVVSEPVLVETTASGETVVEDAAVEEVVVEEAAPAQEEVKAAKEEPKKDKKSSKKKKKKSSKKKKSKKAPADEPASE